MLLQVLLDQVVGGLFGLTEPSDDERKSVSQRLLLLSSFLKQHPFTDMTITTKISQSRGKMAKRKMLTLHVRPISNTLP